MAKVQTLSISQLQEILGSNAPTRVEYDNAVKHDKAVNHINSIRGIKRCKSKINDIEQINLKRLEKGLPPLISHNSNISLSLHKDISSYEDPLYNGNIT